MNAGHLAPRGRQRQDFRWSVKLDGQRVTVVTLFARTLVTLFEKVGRVEIAVEA